MPQEYLFACSSCQKDFPVTVKLAGMAYSCPLCDAANDLPGLRLLKQLPMAEQPAATKTKVQRNETGAWLFSGGLLIAVVAGLCGLALMLYANSLVADSQLESNIEFRRAQIDTLPAGNLWEAWDSMTREGLPDWQETVVVRYNKQAGHLSSIAYSLFAVAGLGLLALLGSFFMGKK